MGIMLTGIVSGSKYKNVSTRLCLHLEVSFNNSLGNCLEDPSKESLKESLGIP